MEGKRKKQCRRSICTAFLLLNMLLIMTACSSPLHKEETTQEAATEERIDITSYDKDKKDSEGYIVRDDYVMVLRYGTEIYTKPDENSEVKFILNRWVDLKRTGVKEDWTRVKMNGSSYYVRTEEVQETKIEWYEQNIENKETHIVYIDAGKQLLPDLEEEEIAPGSERLKRRAGQSAVGVETGVFAYEVNLNAALSLRDALEERGYTVYMSRNVNDINISNKERATKANSLEAEIYIRLEAENGETPEDTGMFAIVPAADNNYSGFNWEKSFRLADAILTATCEGTKAQRMGIYGQNDMTILNWASMPIVVIQMGYLSNIKDDSNLNDSMYVKTMTGYMADGVDEYFRYLEKEAEEAEQE